MGLIRLVMIILLAWLVWQLVKATLARTGRLRARRGTGDMQNGEKMLPCVRCGVHVPASQAIVDRDQAFCCRSHHNEHQRDHGD